ncbi:MAG: zf-HC2 domain-containing protein [Acidobacteriota bacterium]|nr:zf-HC2 domain-containing protein [Acidobacteriota bacterium]
MNGMSCKDVQASFSSYLDGAISGVEMQEIARHIEGAASGAGRVGGCDDCARELTAWKLTQNAVAALGPAKAPADLPLKLRLAVSREHARRESRWLDRLSLAWDNVLRPRLVQVSAGLAGSMVLGSTALLMGVVAVPQPVLANDEPLGAITAPHYLYSTFASAGFVSARDPIVVEALVDSSGRVYDFTIVSGQQNEAVRTLVTDQLLGSVFQPASAFGVPVRGRVVVTYSGISVHG